MKTRQEAILQAWNLAWGRGEISAFEDFISPTYIRRSKSGSEDFVQLRTTIEAIHEAFPDFTTRILHFVENGPSAAIHWESSGTHQGVFMGVPATGRSMTVSGASFLQFDGGLLCEESVIWDPRDLLSALGIWQLGSTNSIV